MPGTSLRVRGPEVTPPTPRGAAEEAEVTSPATTTIARITQGDLTPSLGTTEAMGLLCMEGSLRDIQVMNTSEFEDTCGNFFCMILQTEVTPPTDATMFRALQVMR